MLQRAAALDAALAATCDTLLAMGGGGGCSNTGNGRAGATEELGNDCSIAATSTGATAAMRVNEPDPPAAQFRVHTKHNHGPKTHKLRQSRKG